MKNSRLIPLAILTTFLWGSAFPCVKIGYALFGITPDDVSTIFLWAGCRFFMAGVMIILIFSIWKRKLLLPKKKEIPAIIGLGIVQITLQYVFFYIGVAHTTGIKSSILYSVNTIAAVVLAHFVYKDDRFSFRKAVGCLLGLIGVIVINLSGLEVGTVTFLGEGCVILAAVLFAIGGLINKKVVQKTDESVVTAYQLIFGAVVLIIAGFGGNGRVEFGNVQADLMLLYLAALSSVSFLIWSYLLKKNKASKVTVFNFLIPVFGVIMSSVFLSEHIFTLKNVIALILVCMGIVFVNFESKREVK